MSSHSAARGPTLPDSDSVGTERSQRPWPPREQQVLPWPGSQPCSTPEEEPLLTPAVPAERAQAASLAGFSRSGFYCSCPWLQFPAALVCAVPCPSPAPETLLLPQCPSSFGLCLEATKTGVFPAPLPFPPSQREGRDGEWGGGEQHFKPLCLPLPWGALHDAGACLGVISGSRSVGA